MIDKRLKNKFCTSACAKRNIGKNKYVSVYTKGQIIQIKEENKSYNLEYDEIRIIPYKENHGIMVEQLKNGKMINT